MVPSPSRSARVPMSRGVRTALRPKSRTRCAPCSGCISFATSQTDRLSGRQSSSPNLAQVWELAACAAFKDAFDKRLAEASQEEEESGLTAERKREIERNLEHNVSRHPCRVHIHPAHTAPPNTRSGPTYLLTPLVLALLASDVYIIIHLMVFFITISEMSMLTLTVSWVYRCRFRLLGIRRSW